MLLDPADNKLFLRLHCELLHFTNQRLGVVPDHVASAEDVRRLHLAKLAQLRDALDAHRGLIDAFVEENPAQLTQEELEIVHSWRHRVSGDFFICGELKEYAVFLTAEEPSIAYGVVALTDPLHRIVGSKLPVLVETVLLPFKGRIIYDGLLSAYSITSGPDIKRSVNEQLKAAKKRYGIITSLSLSDEPLPATTRKAKPSKSKPNKAPSLGNSPSENGGEDVLQVIVGLVDRFCKKHLNKEYAELCVRLAEKLADKQPSPLLKGSPNAWASGIVRTIGWVNFLHDKSQKPYMRATDVDRHLGVSSSTGAARSTEIRKLMKLYALDPEWTLPSRLEDNPLVWMLSVNGFVIDARMAPRQIQEQAYLEGLIPYIPADREDGEGDVPGRNAE